MLYIVGLGLCDGQDITVRGLAAVKRAKAVYIESYTSLLQCTHEELQTQLGVAIEQLNRTAVEGEIDRVLMSAKTDDVVVLVIGDPFGATTHTDLYLRAKECGVFVEVIHNASIMNAIGATGLELYRFGKTVSIPYWSQGFEPTSFLDGILDNHARGLHTLCLLDIKADENRFMSVREGILHLELAAKKIGSAESTSFVTDDLLVVGCARIGCPDAIIKCGPLSSIRDVRFGKSPHCIVIPGKIHHIEQEMLSLWNV